MRCNLSGLKFLQTFEIRVNEGKQINDEKGLWIVVAHMYMYWTMKTIKVGLMIFLLHVYTIIGIAFLKTQTVKPSVFFHKQLECYGIREDPRKWSKGLFCFYCCIYFFPKKRTFCGFDLEGVIRWRWMWFLNIKTPKLIIHSSSPHHNVTTTVKNKMCIGNGIQYYFQQFNLNSLFFFYTPNNSHLLICF